MPASPVSTRIAPTLFAVCKKIAAVTLALAGIGLILWLDSWFMQHADMPDFSRDMSYGLLLLVGFLTSFHCVGMCGPLIIGYTAKQASAGTKSHASHLLYGAGKTLSYTVIGGLFGAFGSVIAFTPATQGAVGIAAGMFLMLFGLHMLNVFPALRHFQFKAPAMVMRFLGQEYRHHHNPFVIGLLNGLMIICGPLQAMYVMAAGSGSWSTGAGTLLFFGLGTLPLLLGFGFLTSLLSARQGVPVKWLIDGKELNECNKAIVVPQYGLGIKLHDGLQVVEFTPKETGVIPWSCWMGMIPGTFIVVENAPSPPSASAKPATDVTETGEKVDLQRLLDTMRRWWQRLGS